MEVCKVGNCLSICNAIARQESEAKIVSERFYFAIVRVVRLKDSYSTVIFHDSVFFQGLSDK